MRASTAASPMPVIVSASPALKARISSSPKATRCSEIAASRTTSADGQGSRPPETPTANSERKLRALLAVVVVMVVRAGCAATATRSTEAPIPTTSRPETRFSHG